MTVNAHTHIYSALARFLPAPDPAPRDFPEILRRVWWRLDRALDEESLRASARLYVAEARALGTTMLVDHHESPNFIEGSLDVIADVCDELGMPALLCYGATERNGGRDEARSGLAECRRFIESNRRPLVRGAVGLHAAFTVSDETIDDAGALARELGVPLHVHVAEDACDRGAFARLRRALVPGSIVAHGVHMTFDEVRAADEMRLWIVQNPRSNRANGVGYPAALGGSSRVALGTDGFPSDLDAEARVLREEEESEPMIATRLRAGEEILRETFGECRPGFSPARRPEGSRAEASRAEARPTFEAIAAKLFERMQHETE